LSLQTAEGDETISSPYKGITCPGRIGQGFVGESTLLAPMPAVSYRRAAGYRGTNGAAPWIACNLPQAQADARAGWRRQ